MEMRLMKAAVLGRRNVAKRVRAESLKKIISYRQTIIDCYKKLPGERQNERDKKCRKQNWRRRREKITMR